MIVLYTKFYTPWLWTTHTTQQKPNNLPYDCRMQVIKLVTFHANVATKKFSLVNRIREMVTFDLCKQIEKEVFCCCCKHGKEKKFWVPTRNRPHAHKEKKHLSLFLYRAKNFPSFLFYLQTWHCQHCWYSQHAGRLTHHRVSVAQW